MKKLFKALCLLVTGGAMIQSFHAPAGAPDSLRAQARQLFGQIAPVKAAEVGHARATLGRHLFWDADLSATRSVSCATCHATSDHSADRRAKSVDAHGKETPRHSQPLFNAELQPRLRWLADRKDSIELIEGLVTGPMGFKDKTELPPRLFERGYAEAFKRAFAGEAEPVTVRNYALAIQAYLKTLRTPARFDLYLAGHDSALSAREKSGLRIFISSGCATCHDGPLLGGARSARFGVTAEYWQETRSAKVDMGQMAVSRRQEDEYSFRVAMLRNIARTAPYFHDGSVQDLDSAIRIMARLQLGRQFAEGEVDDVKAFLSSLTGEVPPHFAPPDDPRLIGRFEELG